jgi:hypothetical protein
LPEPKKGAAGDATEVDLIRSVAGSGGADATVTSGVDRLESGRRGFYGFGHQSRFQGPVRPAPWHKEKPPCQRRP